MVPWAAMQDSFTSRLSEIRHITELMPLAPKGREEVNHNIPLLGESVETSLAEITAGQPGFKGMVGRDENKRKKQTFA